ncbi:MAG: hypothetical protein AVDCRST_MAG75-953 [uncultured Propionibacteriaceae bacterium]|uniref:DUF664 domain-containing protein n=1 Tax=uncultured Propionibacteriaceae bacterium TaxID=257457 RepID=A0A6J4NCJ5_9ACTN|nr:MAG: hypothetical protein AVDCRST_MAG75-953 [uncultured Propionibacteriaceae bacterium]
MAEHTAAVSILSDAFGRVHDLVGEVTTGLTEPVATYRLHPEANTVGWLVWHLSRVQDDHVADAAGTDQVWPLWRDRFGLPFDDYATGYGQTPEEVGAVEVTGELLAGYHAEVHRATARYLESVTAAELERVVDDSWDPPVTVSVRLVSVISDCLQHLGQAAYVRGLTERG